MIKVSCEVVMREEVIQVLTNSNKKNFTIVEIAKKLEQSEEKIKNVIKELQEQDKVVKSGKDKYRFNTYHPEKEEKEQLIRKVLETIKEKKFTTLHELKIALNFKKPEQIAFLRKLLKELEQEKRIFHSEARGFYSLEKVNYFSATYLEEHILKILQKLPYVSYKRLKKELHFTKEDDEAELIKVLEELEKNGKIYSKNKMYQKMPTSYKMATIVEVWGGGNLSAELVESGERIKIPFSNANGVLKNDTVIVSMNEEEKKHKIKKVLERQMDTIVCEVIMNEEKKELKPFRMTSTLKPRISSKEMKELVVGDLILVNVSTEEIDGYYEANKIQNVGNVNDPGVDLKCIALNYGFSEEFSKKALEETKNIPKEVTESELVGREDLREKTIVTIDDETCKDMDDAISLEKLENGYYRLGVHIADVSHYIKSDSALYEEAKMRGTSLYMINTSIPMLPRILTNGILSLNPLADRLTMTCEMTISPEGKVVDYRIFDSVICSKKKMSYQEVNKVIEGHSSPSYKPYEKMILEMQKLSLLLTKNKKERGYLEFASVEAQFQEDETGKIVEIRKREQKDAEKIIENFMVLANETVDTHLFWLGFPKLARTHQEPDEAKLKSCIAIFQEAGYRIKIQKEIPISKQIPTILNNLRRYEEFPILSNMLLRCMARASYTTDTIGHFGLKLQRYMHFTSPIRRFPDLEIHTLLHLYHSNEIEKINFEQLENALRIDAAYSSDRERMADEAERQAEALKSVTFYEEKIGEEVVGHITGVTYKKLLVQTNDLVAGTINIEDIQTCNLGKHGNRSLDFRIKMDHLRIGSKVLLKVKEVNYDEKLVHFILEKNLSWKQDKDLILSRNLNK